MASLTPDQIKTGWDEIGNLFGQNDIGELIDYVKNNPYYINAKNPVWENNTILQMFVVDEDEKHVADYLKLKPDLKQLVYERGGTILMQVVENELEPNIAEMLIKANPETVNIANDAGQTPLMFAIQHEDKYLVYDLVKYGAKKDVKDSSGNDVWSYFHGDEDTRKELADAMNGINPGITEDLSEDEIQSFLKAIVDGDESKIKSMIEEDERFLNAKSGNGEYGLQLAAGLQKVAIVKMFLKYDDIEFDDDLLEYVQSFTVPTLPRSTTEPAREIYRLLIERHHEGETETLDADDEEEEEEEEEEGEPLTIAELAARNKLHKAIEARDNVTAIAVLAQYPKLANVLYSGETPLTTAVSSRNLEFVKHLIAAGVYIDDDDVEHAEYLAGHTTTGLTEEEKKLAQDIVAVIQAHVAPAIAPRALDFGAEPAVVLPKLEVIEASYTDMPTAYDMLEMEDMALFDLITSGEKMIFKVKDIYFSTDLTPLHSAMQDKSSTFYECKKELDGTPYTKDVHADTPYFRVQLNGNFTVPEQQLQAALASKYSIFELMPSEKKLAFVASYASVQTSPGKDGLGRQVNIVSADHCQKGSQQVTYTLKAVTMAKKKAGGAKKRGGKKRSTYRKGKKSNKRKTYRM
jgi:ankyrin repeat protein